MKNLPNLAPTKNLIVGVVIVLDAVTAVIGTILAIRQVGAGYKMWRIGKRKIGIVIIVIVFLTVLRNVMVQHVIMIIIIVMHAYVMTTSKTISKTILIWSFLILYLIYC